MNLNCETILDFYTLNGRKVLCQIKVNRKSKKLVNTCRCLSQEQWVKFDKKLEKLLTAYDCLHEKGLKFNIKPFIEVKVQKSKLSFRHFSKMLDIFGEFNKGDIIDEQGLVLECLIDFQPEVPLSSSTETQEYEPEVNISKDVKLSSQLSYEPYTPSKKKILGDTIDLANKKNVDYHECNEDTYSPKPLTVNEVTELHLTQSIPQYTPAPIKDRLSSKERKKIKPLNDTVEGISCPVKQKSRKKYKRVECEYIPKSHDVATVNVPVYIPTPIEEIARKTMCGADNTRTYRKRSNTIDVFSELENLEEKRIQDVDKYTGKVKNNQWYNKSFKKRSMTIDEIPAELADMPVYIPTPLEETTLQKALKTCEFRKNKDVLSSQCNENAKKFASEKSFSMTIGSSVRSEHFNSQPKIPTEEFSNTLELWQQQRVFNKEKVDTDKKINHCKNKNMETNSMIIHEIPAERAASHVLFTSNENEQLSSLIKEGAPLKNDLENAVTISSSSESESFIKKSKKPPKVQRKENDPTSKEYNKNNKRIKKLLDNLSVNDTHHQIKTFRRSDRSPNKPKRLMEEHASSTNSNEIKKHKTSLKHRDLFGSDDDDDDDVGHCFINTNHNKMFEKFCEIPGNQDFVQDYLPSSSMSKKKCTRFTDYVVGKEKYKFNEEPSGSLPEPLIYSSSSTSPSWIVSPRAVADDMGNSSISFDGRKEGILKQEARKHTS